MLNNLTSDILDDVIERLQAMRKDVADNASFHVDQAKIKDVAEDLRSLAELLWEKE